MYVLKVNGNKSTYVAGFEFDDGKWLPTRCRKADNAKRFESEKDIYEMFKKLDCLDYIEFYTPEEVDL